VHRYDDTVPGTVPGPQRASNLGHADPDEHRRGLRHSKSDIVNLVIGKAKGPTHVARDKTQDT
jgi:hypothetical protein